MSSVKAAQALVALLEAHGIRAVLDPRNVTPPCVLINPPTQSFQGVPGVEYGWTLHAIVPGAFNLDAWATLDTLAARVADIIAADTIAPADVTTGQGEPLPAFEITFTQLGEI